MEIDEKKDAAETDPCEILKREVQELHQALLARVREMQEEMIKLQEDYRIRMKENAEYLLKIQMEQQDELKQIQEKINAILRAPGP